VVRVELPGVTPTEEPEPAAKVTRAARVEVSGVTPAEEPEPAVKVTRAVRVEVSRVTPTEEPAAKVMRAVSPAAPPRVERAERPVVNPEPQEIAVRAAAARAAWRAMRRASRTDSQQPSLALGSLGHACGDIVAGSRRCK
jgi:hypothetical protein